MIQAGLASQADIPEMKALWHTCFGDDMAYIDHFFASVFVPEQAIVLHQEGSVCAMTLYFPLRLKSGEGEEKQAAYLYAVATDPKFRNQGLSTGLLEFTAGYLSAKGFQALVLVPGNEDLFRFYQKRGYVPFFYHQVISLAPGATVAGKMARANGEEYGSVRESLLQHRSHLTYPISLLEYQKSLCLQTGGDLVAFTDCEGRFGCAALEYVAEGRMLLKELLWPGDLQEAIGILQPHFPAQTYVLRIPASQPESAHAFGMYRPLDNQLPSGSSYLGFAFD